MPKITATEVSCANRPDVPVELEEAGVFLAERIVEFCEGYREPERAAILNACRRRLKQEGGIYRMACASDVGPTRRFGV